MDTINSSESAQMYLVAMAQLAEIIAECPIPVARVAEVLGITPISANQMIHTLEQAGLVTYTPYKGVAFTETGYQMAAQIIRNRRLWEVFLVEHLEYPPPEAETLACRLEHAILPETADRLAEFLGNPAVSPRGKPIPTGAATLSQAPSGVPLGDLPAGTQGRISVLPLEDTIRTFLEQVGLPVGGRFDILGIQQNGACLLRCEDGTLINLAAELAQQIQALPENHTTQAD